MTGIFSNSLLFFTASCNFTRFIFSSWQRYGRLFTFPKNILLDLQIYFGSHGIFTASNEGAEMFFHCCVKLFSKGLDKLHETPLSLFYQTAKQ